MILASPSTWRSHPHTIKGYLYAHVPDVVFQASVNQTVFTNPVVSLTYDTVVTGAYTDIVVGMKVRFEDDSGNIKGYGVVRKTPTSAILYPVPVGYNDIQFEDNDVIVVLDEYPLAAWTPRIDASAPRNVVMYKNYDTAYSDQGAEPNPVCVAGPDYINFVDDDEIITVDFDMTDSYAVAPSATIDDYDAELVDGTVIDGSIASGVFTATFPAGKRHVLLTVTDSNDKTHTAKRLVVACERTGANAPLRVAVGNLRGTLEGWDAEFAILEDDVSRTVIREGAKLLYFEEESYAGEAGSLNGYAGREHIKFNGWAQSAAVGIDPETSDVRITATGPLGILRTLPGFSQSIENAASPNKWHKVKSLTLFRALWYMLYWHTTLLDICDLELPSWYASYPYARFDVDQSDPYTQVDTLAQSVTARLTADHLGIFYLRKNPVTLTSIERDNLNTIVSLISSDWNHIDIEERHRRPNYWLRASGLLASTSGSPKAYLAIAPSTLPGDGQNEDTFDRQLVESQADLNTRAGHVYAERNTAHPRQTIKILNAGMIADPAWREWIKLTLDDETNKRGISYASNRFVMLETSVNIDTETGAAEEDWVLQEETTGVAATAYTLPANQINDVAFTPFVPFELTIPDAIPLAQLPSPIGPSLANTPAYYVLATASPFYNTTRLMRCRNFGTGVETWEEVFATADLPDVPTNWLHLTLDSWNPRNQAYLVAYNNSVSPTDMWIYGVSNLNGDPGAQTIATLWDNAAHGGGSLFAPPGPVLSSINVDGLLYAMIGETFHDISVIKRASRSAAFTTNVPSGDGADGLIYDIGKHWASAVSGTVYYAVRSPNTVIARSTDGGATFSTVYSGGSPIFGNFVHVPYDNNPNDNIVFVGLDDQLFRQNQDLSQDFIDPSSGAGEVPIAIHTYTGDRNYMAMITSLASNQYIRISTDGGDTWSAHVTNPSSGGDETELEALLLGWPFNQETMVISIRGGGNAGIWWTEDLFSGSPPTWNNAVGDFASFEGIQSGVPVWLT